MGLSFFFSPFSLQSESDRNDVKIKLCEATNAGQGRLTEAGQDREMELSAERAWPFIRYKWEWMTFIK